MPPLPLPLSSLQKPGKAWALGALGALPAVVVLWVLCLIKRIRVPNLCQARSRQTCWGIHAFKVVKWQLSNELGQWYISAKYYFQLRVAKKWQDFLSGFLANTFFSFSLECLLTPIQKKIECFQIQIYFYFYVSFDLSIALTKTKYIKLSTKTHFFKNNIRLLYTLQKRKLLFLFLFSYRPCQSV